MENSDVKTAETDKPARMIPPQVPVAPERPVVEDPGLAHFMAEAAGAPAMDEDGKASIGESLPEGAAIATRDDIVDALQQVHDPEIPVNIWELGLVYKAEIDDKGDVYIEMTLTAPACPVAGQMPGMVAQEISKLDGVGIITVQLTWEPSWSPDKMSEDARLALGYF